MEGDEEIFEVRFPKYYRIIQIIFSCLRIVFISVIAIGVSYFFFIGLYFDLYNLYWLVIKPKMVILSISFDSEVIKIKLLNGETKEFSSNDLFYEVISSRHEHLVEKDTKMKWRVNRHILDHLSLREKLTGMLASTG